MTDAEILAAGAAFAGGACHSATGFGFALVAAPLIVAALPPETAVATGLVLGVLMSALTLATEGRVPEPLWAESAKLVAWGAAGAVAGALLLDRLDRTALQLLVTVGVAVALATRWSRTLRKGSGPFRRVWPAGLAAGALTATTTTNGPPLVLYLLARHVPPAQMRDTLGVLFVAFGSMGIAAIAIGAGLHLPAAGVLAALAAAAAAGHVAGRPLFRRLAAGSYEGVVTALLAISVVTGVVITLS